VNRYDADLEQLATQLGRMVANPGEVATDTAVVNRARVAIRRWCRVVLEDVAPAQRAEVAKRPDLADLASHPIGVLQMLLADDPTPAMLDAPSSPEAGEAANVQWRGLASAVEVVANDWLSSDPAYRPTGERAWTAVADVAAVAEAAALLDRDLVAKHVSLRQPAARDCWEIAIAAEQVRHLAASGTLPPVRPLRPAARHLKPVPVRGIDTLAPTLANLAAIIAGAHSLGPGTVGALAATHARTVHTLAGALAATGPPAQRAVRKQLATALRNHASNLVNVQVASRPLRSLEADDPRPTLQMQQIRDGLRRLGAARTARLTFRHDQPSLLAALGAALSVGPAMAACACTQIQSGRWLRPRNDAQAEWEKVTPDAPIAGTVLLVLRQARTLAPQLPKARYASVRHQSPHEILSPQLLRSDRRRALSPAAHGPALGEVVGG
jgi:hypothetical protein